MGLDADTEEQFARTWMPRKKTPAYQLFERKMQGERLGKRLKGLLELTNHMVMEEYRACLEEVFADLHQRGTLRLELLVSAE